MYYAKYGGMFMFKNIRALAVYATDIEKAKKFYKEILKFDVSAEIGQNLCFLKSSSGDTYCFQFKDPDGNIIEVAGKP